MQVVAHHGECQNIDPELSGQILQTLLDPEFPMIKTLSGDRVSAAQKRAPDTPVDAVVNPDFVFINNMLPRHASHGCPSIGA
jgi:hypothetical protein